LRCVSLAANALDFGSSSARPAGSPVADSAAIAAAAVSLACIGLYGTLSYLGRLRQREVGVRLALGAMRNQIVARFLFQGLRVAAIGCAVGLALGLWLSRFISSMLYGVSALDSATYSAVICLILLVAATASLLPAVRASRVEPVQVLREE
jgi:putative ABC transport system permease protein